VTVTDEQIDWSSVLGQYHLTHWQDGDFAGHVPAVRYSISAYLTECANLRAQLAALQRDHAASAARVAALEALNSQAARLLQDYASDAHDEDVPDVQRWLAVYESRQKREALVQPDAARPAGEMT
jgi:hypothetical protein